MENTKRLYIFCGNKWIFDYIRVRIPLDNIYGKNIKYLYSTRDIEGIHGADYLVWYDGLRLRRDEEVDQIFYMLLYLNWHRIEIDSIIEGGLR